jgi:hypothetical protein
MARLALTYGEELLADRVFLHRAAEHSLACRLREDVPEGSRFREVLERMALPTWVEFPYGGLETGEDAAGDELLDEQGAHSVYLRKRTPHPGEIERLAQELVTKNKPAPKTGQLGIVGQAFIGPSFWLGVNPQDELLQREHHPANVEVDRSAQRFLHVHLSELTFPKDDPRPDFRARAMAFKALRRAMLRESILVRLLPDFEEREDDQWATLLVRHFTESTPGRQESMLRLMGVFIEDWAAASGAIDDPMSARNSFYEATKVTEAVALVIGETKNDTRSRRFQGFNSPLLPDILVCGQIAQEGIDLHRHCSHVVHYDLAWNPATLEQRTGRIDRIGSRTQRLRQLGSGDSNSVENAAPSIADARLEVNTPYLAGTYDERMFEELRLRAQTFEVLLGGDLAGSRDDTVHEPGKRSDNASDEPQENEGEERAYGLTALPDSLAESLRVDLAVWRPQ